jgi:hypothetical protein
MENKKKRGGRRRSFNFKMCGYEREGAMGMVAVAANEVQGKLYQRKERRIPLGKISRKEPPLTKESGG